MDFVSEIKNAFSRELPDSELFVYNCVGSTNDEARKYASKKKRDSAFFIAREQTAGRGRRGRSFISRDGGLYLSYLFNPKLSARDAIMLTVFASVALAETIEEMTGARPGIKWVNDIFLGGKKLAGILAEGEFSRDGGSFEYAVVGIGINLNGRLSEPEIKDIATTLECELGVRVKISDFAARLAKKLLSFEKRSAASYMDKYRELSLVIGKRVLVTSAGCELFAKVLGIEDDGAITVRLDTGEEKTLYSAEVSLKL